MPILGCIWIRWTGKTLKDEAKFNFYFNFFIIFIVTLVFEISLAIPYSVFADAGWMYVTNYGSDTVIGIDTKTNTVKSPIDLDRTDFVVNYPSAIAFDSNHKRMYIVNYLSTTMLGGIPVGSVSIIDTKTETLFRNSIQLGIGPGPIAFDPEHNRMYVVHEGSNNVWVIDTITNTVLGSPIQVGKHPEGIAFDSFNKKMYVTNSDDDSVSIIDTSTNKVTTLSLNVDTYNYPSTIAFDSTDNNMYVTGIKGISIIDTVSENVLKDPGGSGNTYLIKVGFTGSGIAFDSYHNRMYVTNPNDTISIIDTAGKASYGFGTVKVGKSPSAIAFDSVNKKMYVTNSGSYDVSIIDTNTNTVKDPPLVVGIRHTSIAFAKP
jgi:YVTN family beta-propeller protein